MRGSRIAGWSVVLAVLAATAGGTSALAEGRALKGTPLDEVTIYRDEVPKDIPLRVRPFSTEGVDLGAGESPEKAKAYAAAQDMKRELPQLAVDRLIYELQSRGWTDVAQLVEGELAPEGAWVLEGRFTELNPGSQAKRYWVSMGAGKSKVCSEGRLLDAQGAIAAEWNHCRVGAVGWFGGRSDDMMTADSSKTSLHTVEFLELWASGKYAK